MQYKVGTATLETPLRMETNKSSYPKYPLSSNYSIKSSNPISPNGDFRISEDIKGDYIYTDIVDRNNKLIVKDFFKDKDESLGFNEKFGCQCGARFGGWHTNSIFIVSIQNGYGEGYEYLADASTGILIENSFQRVK